MEQTVSFTPLEEVPEVVRQFLRVDPGLQEQVQGVSLRGLLMMEEFGILPCTVEPADEQIVAGSRPFQDAEDHPVEEWVTDEIIEAGPEDGASPFIEG